MTRAIVMLLLAWVHGLAIPALAQTARQWESARALMVQNDVVEAGIKDERVCAALRAVPRHLFVPPDQRKYAYFDAALPIGDGQTISPPFVVAYMTEQLAPKPTDRVLEIGTGSGYQAAVLSELVDEVYSIEIVEPLARRAATTLRRLGYRNVHTKAGDGFQGWPEHAPFDKIIVTCSPEQVPRPLVEQLREGGRMVIPLGERFQQSLYLLKKVDGKLQREALQATYFVPMTGRAEELRQVKNDSAEPALRNGGFEDHNERDEPASWYYVRQSTVKRDDGSPQGECCLECSNADPGRNAHVMQAVGVDGREVRELEVSFWVRTDEVIPGQSLGQLPRFELNFFDEDRALIGSQRVGPWHGTMQWTRKQAIFRVPAAARLAVVSVGLYGASGTACFDDVQVRASRGDR